MIVVKQVEISCTTRNEYSEAKPKNRILQDLDHPNIVHYLGFEETPRFLNMCVHHCSCTYCLLITFLNSFLEYVPGGSIADCLRHHGKFDEEVTKSFTTQILGALAYLHSQGIVHGVRQRHIYLAITLTSSLF